MNERKNISQRQKIERSLEAIEELQQNYQKLVGDVNEVLGNVSQQLAQSVETLNAIVGVIGVDKVAEAIKTERAAKAQADADAKKAAVASLVKDNKVVAAAIVCKDSLVVGRDLNESGEVIPPGYNIVAMANASEEFAKKAEGAKVGDKLAVVPGRSFEVTEIYQFAPVVKPMTNVTAELAPAPAQG